MARTITQPDLASYVSDIDIDIVKKRIPKEFKTRLRDVFIRSENFAVRTLGYVSTGGRRDININARLPYRVSLGRFIYKGQSAKEFGATAKGQWTPWAVRRFLLYDVFLHELGHLQVINPKSVNFRRKFASEGLAEEFADTLRRQLFSLRFDHPDPIHNPPGSDELSVVDLWQGLNKHQRFCLVDLVLKAPHLTVPDLHKFGNITDEQESFLTRALCFIRARPPQTEK